jgi:hypothetical protein
MAHDPAMTPAAQSRLFSLVGHMAPPCDSPSDVLERAKVKNVQRLLEAAALKPARSPWREAHVSPEQLQRRAVVFPSLDVHPAALRRALAPISTNAERSLDLQLIKPQPTHEGLSFVPQTRLQQPDHRTSTPQCGHQDTCVAAPTAQALWPARVQK